MSLTAEDWQQAQRFIDDLGGDASVLGASAFQKDAETFLELLLKKNQEVNLTGAKDLQTAFWKHFVDSLSLLAFGDLGVVVDWGSGGGLPSIPLALARKHTGNVLGIHFLDSVGKKVHAVLGFCEALSLTNACGHIGRGEQLMGKGALSSVDTAVMRAVAPAERAAPWIRPYAKQWVLFLGPSQVLDWRSREKSLRRAGMEISEAKSFKLPHDLGERSLLRISKSST